jgi:methionyl-tRNA synthetase
MGFALEIVRADVMARYNRMNGNNVFFNTGTDEHGLKIYRQAAEEKVPVQEYVNTYADRFKTLKDPLALSYDNFIRTTDPNHINAAQEFWRRCQKNDDIYKKHYEVKYCVGCELEKTESELEDGLCPYHPSQTPELIEEENYFFRFSEYQQKLLELYDKHPDFVVPDFRLNEVRKFAERGLQDFSISRLRDKMPWGVPVPDDEEHVMYVWFDALVNYISAIGWPDNNESFQKWWPVVQIAGKDNLRQQSAMWQAMLLSAGLPASRQILINGFITSGGQKMSKSVGNVLDPLLFVEKYGTDALRYYLLRHVHQFEDADMTEESFKEAYNAHLANGLGNLVARTMKMASEYLEKPVVVSDETFDEVIKGEYQLLMNKFELQKASELIWRRISELDQYVEDSKPFKAIKEDENKAKDDIVYLVGGLAGVAHMLTPFMPETAETIKQAIIENKKPETLFVRV